MQVREVHRPSHRRRSRFARGLVAVAIAGLVLAACGNGEEDVEEPAAEEPEDAEDTTEPDDAEEAEPAEDWPDDRIRILVGASEGGGLDTIARLLQGPLSEELGVDVIVENHVGANTSIANQIAYNEGDECYDVVHNNFPIFSFSYHVNDVDYTYDDVYPIAATQRQPAVFVVPGDSPIDTLQELVDEMEARPGELTASVSALAGTNTLGIMELEDALGLDANVIDYDGGSPARQAVISGEVDFSHTSVFAAMPLLEGGELKILAAHQTPEDWADFADVDVLADVPTVEEAIGVEVTSNTASYGLTANRTCYENFPERYQILHDATRAVLDSPEWTELLEELDLELSVMNISAEDYHATLEAEQEVVRQFAEEQF